VLPPTSTADWLGLAGRQVVLAGAGGIGTACAERFRSAGARLCIVDVDQERLDKLVAELGGPDDGLTALTADLTSGPACRATLAEAGRRLGRIDVLVHSVGVNLRQPVTDVTDDDWDRILTTNLSTAYWLGQAAGRSMRQQRYGRLVFLSSVSGLLAHKDHALYAASKGGLNQLLRVMAHEWAVDGVTANAVAPGYVETPLTSAYLARPGVRESLTSLVPAGRLGKPEDVADAVLFLASERAAFITGQVLYVDGGRTLV
jgi:gluconate 5-dehydrogenase